MERRGGGAEEQSRGGGVEGLKVEEGRRGEREMEEGWRSGGAEEARRRERKSGGGNGVSGGASVGAEAGGRGGGASAARARRARALNGCVRLTTQTLCEAEEARGAEMRRKVTNAEATTDFEEEASIFSPFA